MLKKLILALVIINIGFLALYNSVFDLTGQFLFIIVAFLAFVFALFFLFRHKKTITFSLWEVLLILVLAVLPLFSYYRFITFMNVCILLSGVILYFIFSKVFSVKEKRVFLIFILLLGIFEALCGFLEYFVCAVFPKSPLAVYFASHSFVAGTRVASFFQYPNAFAGFLLMPFFISMYFLHSAEKRRAKMLLTVISAFILFVIYLASSRGSYIVLLISIAIVLVLEKNKKKISLEFVLVFAISILFYALNRKIFYSSFEANIERTKVLVKFFAGEPNRSLSDRIQLAKDAIMIFLRHPIFGTGLGTFKDAMLKYRVGLFFAREPHSLPFRILAESGISGFIALFGFYYEKTVNSIKKNPLLFVSVIAVLLHTFLDLDFAYPLISSLIFIGFALIEDRGQDKKFLKLPPKTAFYTAVVLFAFIVAVLVPGLASSMYFNGGNDLLAKNEYKRAVSSYSVSLKLLPVNAESHSQLAYAYEKIAYSSSEDCKFYIDKAISEYKSASSLNKLSFIYPFYEGNLYLLEKNPESLNCFKRSVSLNPLWKPIYSDIALSAAYTKKDSKSAIKFAKEALSFNAPEEAYKSLRYTTPEEKDSTAYTALGFALSKQEFFDRAISLDPNNGFAYLGEYFTEQDPVLKLEALKKSIDANKCIFLARNLYFSNAPLLNVKNTRLRDGNMKVVLEVLRNADMIRKIKVFIITGDKKLMVKEFEGNVRVLEFSIPKEVSSKFRVKIEGIDKNGFAISAVISPKFETGR